MLVLMQTAGSGTRRSCGAAITWYELVQSHRRHPFDGAPVPRNVVGWGAGQVGELDTAIDTSHFATCPQAKQWRRRK